MDSDTTEISYGPCFSSAAKEYRRDRMANVFPADEPPCTIRTRLRSPLILTAVVVGINF